NVLLGHLIPAGTGFRAYQAIRVKHLAEPPAAEEFDEETMLSEAAQAAEALGASPDEPTGDISIGRTETLMGEASGAAGAGKEYPARPSRSPTRPRPPAGAVFMRATAARAVTDPGRVRRDAGGDHQEGTGRRPPARAAPSLPYG